MSKQCEEWMDGGEALPAAQYHSLIVDASRYLPGCLDLSKG